MVNRILLLLFLAFSLYSCNPTNFDEVLFEGSPEAFICQAQELPGIYFLIDDLSGPRPNEDLVININEPAATEQYLNLTGRISGWEYRYMLGEPTKSLPGFFLCQVVTFESIDGANQALHWPTDEGRTIIQNSRNIGDDTILTADLFDAPDGSPWMDYRVEFTFRNLLITISTYSPEDIADPDYALDLAETIQQRLFEVITNN
jgi:hypothetical protein